MNNPKPTPKMTHEQWDKLMAELEKRIKRCANQVSNFANDLKDDDPMLSFVSYGTTALTSAAQLKIYQPIYAQLMVDGICYDWRVTVKAMQDDVLTNATYPPAAPRLLDEAIHRAIIQAKGRIAYTLIELCGDDPDSK